MSDDLESKLRNLSPQGLPAGYAFAYALLQYLHLDSMEGVHRLLGSPDRMVPLGVQGREREIYRLTPERREIIERERARWERADTARRREAEQRREEELRRLRQKEVSQELAEHAWQLEEDQRPGTHPGLTIERALARTRHTWRMLGDPADEVGCITARVEPYCGLSQEEGDDPVAPYAGGSTQIALYDYRVVPEVWDGLARRGEGGPFMSVPVLDYIRQPVDFDNPEMVAAAVERLCEDLDRLIEHDGWCECEYRRAIDEGREPPPSARPAEPEPRVARTASSCCGKRYSGMECYICDSPTVCSGCNVCDECGEDDSGG